MSYFYSNAGGGGGSGNKQIRYSVIIDTAQLESQLRSLGLNLKTAFESGNTSIAGLGTGIQNIGTQMTATTAKANTFTGALQQFNTTAANSNTGMNTLTGGLGTFNTGVQSSNTQLTTFTGALRTFDTNTKTLTTSVGGTSSSISIMSDNFNKLATGGLTSTNTLAGETVGGFDKLEKQTGKTTGTLGKLREGFAGNRGLIYSMGTIFGTMTGVIAEMQLLDDAHAQVAEATAKLTKLEADGQKGTREYTQAMQQKEKAERFSSFTTRNLALATANFVPELLLLATNLSRNEGIGKKLSGVWGKLRGESTELSGALKATGLAGSAGAVGLNAFAAGMARVSAPIAAIGAVVLGVILSIQRIGDMFKLSSGDIKQQREALDDWFNGWRKIPIIGPLLESILDPLGLMPKVTLGAVDATNKLTDATGKSIPKAKLLAEAQKDLKDKQAALLDAQIKGGETVLKNKAVHEAEIRVVQILNGTIDENTTSVIANNGMWIDMSGAVNMGASTYKNLDTAVAKSTQSILEATGRIKDHGAAIKQGAQQQYDYDQQLETAMQGWTKYRETLVTLDQELNNSFGIYAKAGDAVIKYGDTLNKTGFEYIDLGNAAKLEAMSEEDRNATIQDAITIYEEYNKLVQDAIDLQNQRNKDIRDLINTEKILNTIGITKNQIMASNIEQVNGLRDAVLDTNNAYQEEEFRLVALLLKYDKLTPKLAALTLNTKDDTVELGNAAVGLKELEKEADKATEVIVDLGKAHEDAVLDMKNFVATAINNAEKTKVMNAVYSELGRTMVGELHTTVPLTTKDFIELGKTFKDGVPLAEKLAKIVDEDLSPAFETFSDVIQAATRKDFKEAWKGLEFGDVGKKFKHELKDILEGMNDIARSGKAVATVVSGLVVGALRGMSDKALGQGIKEITEQFNRFKSLDPDASIVQPLYNFVNALPTKDKAAGILAVHQGLEDMATAQQAGNLTQEKATEIMGKYKPMIDAYNKAIGEGKTPTDALAIATGQVGASVDDTSGKFDPFQKNLVNSAEAYTYFYNTVNENPISIPAPEFSGFDKALLNSAEAYVTFYNTVTTTKINLPAPNITAATNAFKSVEVNWKGYANKIKSIVPNITVNNKQALDAISKVVSAMNNVKNISRTITITTVYKTQGSPATSTRTSTRTGVTAGAGAHTSTREGISTVTPFMPSETTNLVAPTAGAGKDINIQIHMRDEFGIEKIRKYKAAMGGNRFVFGTVGAGG